MTGAGISYVAPPRTLRGFPRAARVRPKTAYGGPGMLRARWRDDDEGTIYEWDYLHGRVEVYDKRGRHIGEFDEATGTQIGPADPRKAVEP